MKEFYTKYKMQIFVGGLFVAIVIILLTLSFGESTYVLN